MPYHDRRPRTPSFLLSQILVFIYFSVNIYNLGLSVSVYYDITTSKTKISTSLKQEGWIIESAFTPIDGTFNTEFNRIIY